MFDIIGYKILILMTHIPEETWVLAFVAQVRAEMMKAKAGLGSNSTDVVLTQDGVPDQLA